MLNSIVPRHGLMVLEPDQPGRTTDGQNFLTIHIAAGTIVDGGEVLAAAVVVAVAE